jgi:hypothetical protein
MAKCPFLWWIVLLGLLAPSPRGFGFDLSYWAWQRSEPLTEAETSELARQDVHTIYWHVGELENQSDAWKWKARYRFPGAHTALHFVPVVRLVSRAAEPFSPPSMDALLAALAPIAGLTGDLQLDFDCPDRLLDAYAGALKRIRSVTSGRLFITALPHWSRADCLRRIAEAPDELFPMLYDYEAEPVLPGGSRPQPLIVPEKMARMLRDWSACQKPWRAGLPCFARLTVYDSKGKSRGQIRNWSWDEIVLNRAFVSTGPTELGTDLLRANSATRIANVRVQPGDQPAVRMTDRTALAEAIARVKETSAQGVVLFRFPDSSASSGWSLPQLGHLDASPRLTLSSSSANESLVLRNDGDGDLPPWFPTGDGTAARGYALEIMFDTPSLREVEPGDFPKLSAGAETTTGPRAVAIPFATTVSFSFSNLGAGQSLSTGLIQLAPGMSFRQARWRVRNADEAWKPLE